MEKNRANKYDEIFLVIWAIIFHGAIAIGIVYLAIKWILGKLG